MLYVTFLATTSWWIKIYIKKEVRERLKLKSTEVSGTIVMHRLPGKSGERRTFPLSPRPTTPLWRRWWSWKWSFAVCTPRWSTFPSQNSLYGVRNDAYGTPESCQAYCVTVATCVAVDFDSSDNSCWLHINAADLLDATTHWQRDSTQYRLNRNCITGLSVWTPANAAWYCVRSRLSVCLSVLNALTFQSINQFISRHSTRATVRLCRIKEKCLETDLKCVDGWSSSTVQWKRVSKSRSSNRETTSSSVQVKAVT